MLVVKSEIHSAVKVISSRLTYDLIYYGTKIDRFYNTQIEKWPVQSFFAYTEMIESDHSTMWKNDIDIFKYSIVGSLFYLMKNFWHD